MFGAGKEYRELNRILDEALSGNFSASRYDESELSRFQNKLVRVLNNSFMSQNQLNEERDKLRELITNISHQTNTPLTNILIYSQLLEEQAENETARKYASEVVLQAQKLELLIQSLVRMSRLETGIFQFEKQSTSLNEIAAAALSSESAKAERKNIRLEGPCGEEVFAMADAKWTTEATANIVSNAVKYSGEGTVITAEVFSNEMFACIRINDQGPGIDPEDIPGIFGRFCRGRGVHDKEGIGVGLYLSRQITEGQGGYIKVSSEPGKGSTFEIYLPVR